MRLTEASNELRETLHADEYLKETKYTENLSMYQKLFSKKATKSVKPPVESEKPLRTPCDSWARSAEEKSTLFAYHLPGVLKPNPPKNEFSPPVIHEILDYSDPKKVKFGDIKQIVKHKIKSKKSPGYDLISPEMIKI